MRSTITEVAVAVALLGALGAAVIVPLRVEASRHDARETEIRTIDLAGVMAQGLWTEEAVPAAAIWRRDFRRARPLLRSGETVRLRLTSADVVHSFAVPALGIGPVEVSPGKTVEVVVAPRETGVFEYYCTTVCGEAHFAMRGFIEVVDDEAATPSVLPLRPGDGYWSATGPPPGADRASRGAWLYRRQGCVTCHGEAGAGGVPNPGSMNATVPPLAALAHRTYLFAVEDVDAFLDVLDRDEPLQAIENVPVVPLFRTVASQYLATRRLVRDGRRSARLDPSSPRPPLDMPAWGARLTDEEIDTILYYLLTLGRDADAATAPHPSSPKGEPR